MIIAVAERIDSNAQQKMRRWRIDKQSAKWGSFQMFYDALLSFECQWPKNTQIPTNIKILGFST